MASRCAAPLRLPALAVSTKASRPCRFFTA
jgi:hypothetical protein